MNEKRAQDVNVVVVFYSRTGQTEKLALAAAVGAVQARGNIRLRRLPETADEKTIAAIPKWRDNCDRMDQEYIAPREADALWADAIIIAIPARLDISSPEMKFFRDWFEPLRSQGKLDGKIGTALTSGSLDTAIAQYGLIVVPFGESGAQDTTSATNSTERIRLHGRHVTEIARANKQAGV